MFAGPYYTITALAESVQFVYDLYMITFSGETVPSKNPLLSLIEQTF